MSPKEKIDLLIDGPPPKVAGCANRRPLPKSTAHDISMASALVEALEKKDQKAIAAQLAWHREEILRVVDLRIERAAKSRKK